MFCHFRRPVHPNTVRRRLRDRGVRARRPYVGTILTRAHRNARRTWCRRHLRITRRQWGSTLFSDESKFNVSNADGRERVYRRRNERFARCCIRQVNRWGGGSVHVWAGMTEFNRTRLVVLNGNINAQRYIDQVLRPVVAPFMRRHLRHGTFQQDNATPHRAILTRNFLQQSNVTVLDWPSNSPDLNPIENIWSELGRAVRQRDPPPANARQLRDALVTEWDNLPQQLLASVVQSMRRRCTACIAAQGGHTRY